jgi:hypothetical protein
MITVNVEKLRKFTIKPRKLRARWTVEDSPPLVYGEDYSNEYGNIGLKQLREKREEITKRWERMGLLDGLVGDLNKNTAALFEGQLSYTIPDNET